jgi:aquaporin TIP
MNTTKAAIAEFIGTFTLTFIGAGSGAAVASISNAGDGATPSLLVAAFAHGVALMIIVYTWGTVSGAHVNPAVTLGALVGGKIDIGKAIIYWIVQFAGAAAAAYLLLYLVGIDGLKSGQTLGIFSGDPGRADSTKVIIIEALLTFLLVSAVYSTAIFNRFGNAVGLAIGFVLVADILMGGPFTGASMNPARSFGPFLALNNLQPFWMYLVGPAIGGVLAGILQAYVIGNEEKK